MLIFPRSENQISVIILSRQMTVFWVTLFPSPHHAQWFISFISSLFRITKIVKFSIQDGRVMTQVTADKLERTQIDAIIYLQMEQDISSDSHLLGKSHEKQVDFELDNGNYAVWLRFQIPNTMTLTLNSCYDQGTACTIGSPLTIHPICLMTSHFQ